MSVDNNVINVVKLIGNNKSVKRAISELIIEDNIFTFESFAPMPDELHYTSPMQKVISNEDYERVILDYRTRMHRGELTEEDNIPISYDLQKRLVLDYGYDNWYDWAINNWGCRGNAQYTEIISDDTFSFYTANATPHIAMVKMSMKYPDIKFIIKYADEDMGYNVGEYTLLNGETIRTNIHRVFNKDSFLMAYELFKDDYYVREMIYELSPNEINDAINNHDNYLHTILLSIVDLEIVDEYYFYGINCFLLDKAVENEQYEYAAKLKKLTDAVELEEIQKIIDEKFGKTE